MSAQQKARVLVVDDYEPLRYLKHRILAKAGFDVSEAATGAQALAAVKTEQPGVVLLDLHLPDMDGFEVCRAIKLESASIRVLYSTSDIAFVDSTGLADGCLTGLEPDVLVSRVKELLESGDEARPAQPLSGSSVPPCLPTRFAPASRTPFQVVECQAHSLASEGMLARVLDCHPYPAAVLNDNRQIVLANRALVTLVQAVDARSLLGLRPGEALKCVHAGDDAGGCGTTEFCQTCGAVQAILEAQLGLPNTKECRVTRMVGHAEESLDLAVSVSPLSGGFALCSVADMSHQKRREALERTFFHDILNSAVALKASAEELVRTLPDAEAARSAEVIATCARELTTEICAQRQLAAGESCELTLTLTSVSVPDLAGEIVARWRRHPAGQGIAVAIQGECPGISMTTDRTLLSRVLDNMLLNALEASQPGGTVIMGWRTTADQVEFHVHNSSVMSYEAQLNIFQRSFSTKGTGRGLGTYCMKLLSEQYLGGTVGFRSAEGEGTTFFARYPLAR